MRFEGYNTPYFAYNVARIRVADEDKVMSQKELTAYVLKNENSENAWERNISDYTVHQVSDKDIIDYLERGHSAKRIDFEYSDKVSALNKLFLTNGDKLLNAGMVLFCDNQYTELQMAIFAGTERLTFNDIQRQHGTVFELVLAAEKYIKNNIHWRVEFDGSLQRKEIPEIPTDAIREALINSFCHKDYGACQSNEVAIFKDRVEIYNPGSFPEGYKPEDFIFGGERPVRRNPLITSVLYYSKDVESFGTGLKRITDVCNEQKCKIEFKMLKSGFVVVFFRSGRSGEEGALTDTPTGTPTDTPTVEMRMGRILALCETPQSREDLMRELKLNDKNHFIQTYINELIKQGRLTRTIPDKPNSPLQKYVAL